MRQGGTGRGGHSGVVAAGGSPICAGPDYGCSGGGARASVAPVAAASPPDWTIVDRDYETLRIGLEAPFHNLGITAVTLAAL